MSSSIPLSSALPYLQLITKSLMCLFLLLNHRPGFQPPTSMFAFVWPASPQVRQASCLPFGLLLVAKFFLLTQHQAPFSPRSLAQPIFKHRHIPHMLPVQCCLLQSCPFHSFCYHLDLCSHGRLRRPLQYTLDSVLHPVCSYTSPSTHHDYIDTLQVQLWSYHSPFSQLSQLFPVVVCVTHKLNTRVCVMLYNPYPSF